MTPRAMCRIVMSALLLFGPLLTEWLSPAQVWGSALNTPPIAAKAASNPTTMDNELVKATSNSTNPGIGSEVVINTPVGACNYVTFTAAMDFREGIWGQAYYSDNPTNPLNNGTQVVLINALNNSPLATTTIHSIPNTGFNFTFPDFSSGSSYTGITTIPNTLKFKLYFIPPAGDSHLPIYFPKAASISGAAVMRFNSEEAGTLRECLVRNDTTGELLTTGIGLGEGNNSNIGPLLYRNGAIGGQVYIRNSGNPITTGVPISNAEVVVYTATQSIQDTPNTPVITSVTDVYGNFMVDAYAGSTPLADGTKVFLRFRNGSNYQGHWLSNLSDPVDCDTPCNPGTITALQKLSLIRVVINQSTAGYSDNYINAPFPDGTPIIAQMVANNKILGKITTDGVNGAVGSYAVAYANSIPVAQSDPVDATGDYIINKISNYVTYTVKFVTPIGTNYVGEWYNNVRAVTNTTATKLFTTVPGTAGNFNNIDATLTGGATLSGTVTDISTSAPIPSVLVSVYKIDPITGQSSIISSTNPNGSGVYTFPGLLDFGTYKVYFRDTAANPFYVAGWWNSAGNVSVATEAAASTFTVNNLAVNQTVNIGLRPGNSIQGVVTLNPGPPINFGSFPLRITVYNVTGTVVQDFNKVITENPPGSGLYDGSYSTAALDDGLYTIQFTPPASFQNTPGYLAGFYHYDGVDNRVDTIAQADPQSIQGATVSPVNITLQQGAGLNIRIFSRADDGTTYIGYNSVTVQVVADSGPNPATPVYATQLSSGVNPSGMVQFTNLPAGPVRVYVFPPGTGAPSYVLTQLDGSTVASILLVQGQYVGTPISNTTLIGYTDVVTRSAEISGLFRVNGVPGVNLSTTQIKAYRTDTNNTEVPVVFVTPPTLNPATGFYDFSAKVQAGTYRFKFIPPAPYLPQYFDTKYNYNSANGLQLNPDDQKVGVNVVFEPGGAFRVKVVDATTCDSAGNNCTPVQNAQLKIFTSTTATSPAVPAELSGNELTTGGIVTGIVTHKPLIQGVNYFISVDGPAGQNYQSVWYSNKLTQATANPIQTQNGQVTNLTIKIAPAARITGTVTRNGAPQSGVAVTAYLLPLPTPLSSAISYQAITLVDGSYALNIPQGNYIVGFNNNIDPIGYYTNATNPNFATTVAAAPIIPSGGTGNINFNFQSVLCGFSGYSIGVATTTSAQITYQTDCSGDTRVYYSLTPNFTDLSNVVSDPAPLNTHDVTIPGLQPNTTYYLKLTSQAQGQSTRITYSTEVAVRTAADGKVWYFASGSTLSGTISSTVETLHLFNNNDTSTTANVTIRYIYLDGTGAPVTVTKTTTVPAGQRKDIDVSTDMGIQADHSTVVSVTNASPPIMVERTVRTSRQNLNYSQPNGGYTIPGATGLSFEWWFANVNVFPETDNYFSIYNPNVITACYSVYYYRNKVAGSTDNAGPEAVTGKLVPPLSRVKFGVKDTGYTPTFSYAPTSIKQFSVRVLSSSSACPANGQVVPLVVEQETYYGSNVLNRKGVTGKTGIPARQPNWLFSDGLIRGVDSQIYVFTNPSSATVITLTYQLERAQLGFNNIVTYTLPANSRFQIGITNPNIVDVGRSYGFSVKIDAAKPVAVERYATYELQPQPNYDGLMSEPAFGRYSTRWQFAGGDTNQDLSGVNVSDMSYILTNPSLTQTVSVTFTYFSSTGGSPTVVSGIQVAPNTRLVIQANQTGSNYSGIGPNKVVAVQIDGSQQIAAERVYYWKTGIWIGGNAIFGYIPPNF